MKKKQIASITLVAIVVVSVVYIFWPEEAPTGESHVDPAAKTAKLFDRMIGGTPFLADSIVDKRTDINGHKVPPMPDPVENKKTVAGIDTDHNGIRDDIDRLVAEEFGNMPEYQDAVIYARSLQFAIEHPTKENGRKALMELACVSHIDTGGQRTHEMLMLTSKVSQLMQNSRDRSRAYGDAFNASHLESCPRK